MKKNVFLCHRPYHILRSCSLIQHFKESDSINILVLFDVPMSDDCVANQRFETNSIYYDFFKEVLYIERKQAPSYKYVGKLFEYCRERRSYFCQRIQKHLDADSLYFFCDDELEMQLMIGMIVERSKTLSKRVLVDEGAVSYDPITIPPKVVVYWYLMARLFGLKGFNYKWKYGSSKYYNLSIANRPDKALFRQPITQMPPLTNDFCEQFRKRLPNNSLNIGAQYYFLYIGTHDKPIEKEIPVINKLHDILKKHNIPFLIKLHPVQNEREYKELFKDYFFLDKSYPVELFFSEKAILGGTISSSLFNASIQGCHSMDLSPLYKMTTLFRPEQFNWVDVPVITSFNQFEQMIVSWIE